MNKNTIMNYFMGKSEGRLNGSFSSKSIKFDQASVTFERVLSSNIGPMDMLLNFCIELVGSLEEPP